MKAPMYQRLRGITSVGISLLCLAFFHVADAKKKKSPDINHMPLVITKPQLALVPTDEYPEVQSQNGVEIKLTPIPVTAHEMITVLLEEKVNWKSLMGDHDSKFVATTVPAYELRPRQLQFDLRITNHMTKILRMKGVALQFSLDGTSIPSGDVANDLQTVMVLPDQSWETRVNGPGLEKLGLNGLILVGIYDVITETDDANNPTKRSNFEWIYGYKISSTKHNAERATHKIEMGASEAHLLAGTHEASQVEAATGWPVSTQFKTVANSPEESQAFETGASDKLVSELLEMESRALDARQRGDKVAMAMLLTDDWIMQGPDGSVLDKRQAIDSFSADPQSEISYEQCSAEDRGTEAVLTCIS